MCYRWRRSRRQIKLWRMLLTPSWGRPAMIAGLVVFSTIGALSGIILSGPRVCYAMARDGLLFRWLGEIH
jgi:amino acid transporter